MKKYPHGLTVLAVDEAIDAYREREYDDPEAGMIAAFEILLASMDKPEDWKQRAEAAENRLVVRSNYYEGVIADGNKRIAELEAKLAELEKQEPVAYVMGEETIEDFNRGYEFFAVRDAENEEEMKSIPLFTRPAPAADLAELVPDEKPVTNDKLLCDNIENNGWNLCRAAILHNIEEAK